MSRRSLGRNLRTAWRINNSRCPTTWVLAIADLRPRQCVPAVGGGVKAIFSRRRSIYMRNWSYEVVEREVRANLVYRDFTRVGGTKAPDAKTMARWGVALGPEVVQQIHERIVHLAREHRVAAGRRMRVDTTVVETNIHYPTDSSLLGDGVRALTRIMKKIAGLTGAAGAALRDRSRSVKLRVLEIARAARAKGRQNGERLAQAYRRLLEATGRVVGQAKRFATEIDNGVKHGGRLTSDRAGRASPR